MYNDIVDIYDEIFPLNKSFLGFLEGYLGEPGSKVLDLGCGPGGYVDTIANKGYQTVGIDSSTGMIERAKDACQGSFYPLSFTEIDQLDGRFDCIFCIGNSLSYLPDDLLGAFLKDVKCLLRDGGCFLLQVVNWDKFKSIGMSDFPLKTLTEGRSFHRQYEPGDRGEVIFHTEIRRGDEVLGAWSDPLYPKYADLLVEKVTGIGFVETVLFGDFERTPYDPVSSPAIVLSARKA